MSGSTSTSWEKLAAEHVGHRCVLRDSRVLECVDCSRKLILPIPVAGTSVPEQFRRPDRPGVPMPTGWRERVAAELAARRAMREPNQ